MGRGLAGRLYGEIQNILEDERSSGNSELSIHEIVSMLRDRFSAYSRMKIGPLTKLVVSSLEKIEKKEGNEILSLGVAGASESEAQQDSSDNESKAIEHPDANILNNSLRSFYQVNNELMEEIQNIPEVDDESGKIVKEVIKSTPQSKRKRRFPRINEDSRHKKRVSGGSGNENDSFGSDRQVTSSIRYSDIGGLQDVMKEVREMVEPALLHPEIYKHLGVSAPVGLLLHGPPGTGKTILTHAVAGELGVKFIKVAAPEIVSGMSGESEAKLRNLFIEAMESAPCLLFLDEIDAITPKRENAGKEMERRIVAQLLNSMDDLGSSDSPVIVIGATNRPDALDPALRRAGRFEKEVIVGIPDEKGRQQILEVMAKKMKLEGDFDFVSLARRTPGFVGADLSSLTKEAASIAVQRVYEDVVRSALGDGKCVSDTLKDFREPLSDEQLAPLCIRMEDFEKALCRVQPSSKREGFATTPDVNWENIGALENLRKELNQSIVLPILAPEIYSSVGLSTPAGVLLFGPPGCGKTLVAKAIANQSRASFISVKGPELLNKFVGESERSVRQLFQRARASAPCIIFFDELDALCPKRGSGGSERGDSVSERVVNQLLTEMDGLEGRKSVFVVAATNRPDIIDPAMLRPGRLDKLCYVPLPDINGRHSILIAQTTRTPLSPDVDLLRIAADARTEGYSGADIASLVREASLIALDESIPNLSEALSDVDSLFANSGSKLLISNSEAIPTKVTMTHFLKALDKVRPSVSEKQRFKYDKLQHILCRSRAIVQDEEVAVQEESELVMKR